MSFIIGAVFFLLVGYITFKYAGNFFKNTGILKMAWGAVFILFIFMNSVIVVPVGATYAGVWFGNVQEKSYEQGLQLVNPMLSFERMNIRQINAEFVSTSGTGKTTGDNEVTAVSKNNLPLTVDVTYMFHLNSKWAWWVYKTYGGDETYFNNLIRIAAQTATKNATSEFTDEEAMTSKRAGLEQKMEAEFKKVLTSNIISQGKGVDIKLAEEVFTILPVQLSKVLPPEQVIAAISNKAAALQDLERQHTLTEIATEIANRREKEGLGINKLFSQLPSGFTPEQIATVLQALATKNNSDAIMKAVETNQVKDLLLNAGNQIAITPSK